MARSVNDTRLLKREQRLKLEVRKKPYWATLIEGQHLGYYRGQRVGKWLARVRRPGSGLDYQQVTLGQADDFADADGQVVLDYPQAQEAARAWFRNLDRNEGRRIGRYSISDALDDYISGFTGRDRANTKRRIETIIKPQIGHLEVAKLTSKAIIEWHRALASSPARIRTAKGAEQNFRETGDSEDARRKRRASANRILTILKAALNFAYQNGKATGDDAWRRVKAFSGVDVARYRYLTDSEARRLTNAADPSFRPMLQAALLTGARYSEICRLQVEDFDPGAKTLLLRETKAGKSRHVYLEEEGVRLVERAIAGKSADQLIFARPDGKPWGPSQQARPLSQACERGKVATTTFHDLRRTYGARLALGSVPMAVIAEAMGHADERITRRHYAHLSPSYVADTVREGMRGMGIVEEDNVETLKIGASMRA
jgi:integrase